MVKVDSFSTYPSHRHPDKMEFISILEGNPGRTIDQNINDGDKNDFFTLPSSVKHRIQNPVDSDYILLVGSISN